MDGWDLATVWFIHRMRIRSTMAKTDSFFIRASVTTQNDGSFDQASIDLGSYVDALAKSVLRVHNVSITVANNASNLPPTANSTADCVWQLTTQSQSALVAPTESERSATVAASLQQVLGDFGHARPLRIFVRSTPAGRSAGPALVGREGSDRAQR